MISPVSGWVDETLCKWSEYALPEDVQCQRSALHVKFAKNGQGSFVVTVHHDEFGGEVAWRVLHVASGTELYYQAYGSIEAPDVTVSEKFEKLPAGTYRLDLGDLESE